jgi:hypothetical protein
MAARCGHCPDTHDTSAQVRDCWNRQHGRPTSDELAAMHEGEAERRGDEWAEGARLRHAESCGQYQADEDQWAGDFGAQQEAEIAAENGWRRVRPDTWQAAEDDLIARQIGTYGYGPAPI